MELTLITKGTLNYAAGLTAGTSTINNINSLTDGALVALDSNGKTLSGTSPQINTDAFYFALGRTTGGPKLSRWIDRKSMKWTKTAYTAPAAKVMVLGTNVDTVTTYNLNLPSVIVEFDIAGVRLVDLDKPVYDTTRYIDAEVTMRGGETATQVVAKVIAAMNADAKFSSLVTAAQIDADNGISITGKTAGFNFSLEPYGILSDADVLAYNEIVRAGTVGLNAGPASITTVVVALEKGKGTPADITALELEASTYSGNANSNYRPSEKWSVPTRVVSTETYVQYIITWTTPNDNELVPKQNMQQELCIAVPSGDTGAGKTILALETILSSM